jgi:4-hydroxybenzoate polyprenyltransferase
MICIVDFDKTFFKNDFFEEQFCKSILTNPFRVFKEVKHANGNWVLYKQQLLTEKIFNNEYEFLINTVVKEWINKNRNRFTKIIAVSASPDAFVKKMLLPFQLFDEVYGSIDINLKGQAKLNFIKQNWDEPFAYIGDSKDDEIIFSAATEAVRVQELSSHKTAYFLIKILRPHNWVKNILIFLPFLLAMQFDSTSFLKLCAGFIALSLMASAGYIVNDINDIQGDRSHPKKRYRPLASGNIGIKQALVLFAITVITGMSIGIYLGIQVLIGLLVYTVLSIMYSLYFKKVRLVDILTLSSFYMFRLFFGAIISATLLTGWFVSTLTFAVFSLAFSKRYFELILNDKNNLSGRAYTKNDIPVLSSLMFCFAIGAILLLNVHAYFVLLIHSPYFFFFVNLFALSMVLFYFNETNNKSDDPVERVLKSPPLLISALLFSALYFFEMLYRQHA